MRRRLALPALAALALAACGGTSNSLSGSAGQVFDLSFDKVRVVRASDTFLVSYEKNGGDVVAKVAILSTSQAPALGAMKSGGTLALAPDASGTPRAQVSRAVGGDSRHTLPPVKEGSFKLDTLTSGHATGSFYITFGQGGDGGDGTTLNGDFDANVETQP